MFLYILKSEILYYSKKMNPITNVKTHTVFISAALTMSEAVTQPHFIKTHKKNEF